MKKTISLLLALIMCLSLCACGDVKESAQAQKIEPTEAEPILETTEAEETEPTMNYAELVPDALQGVWVDTSIDGTLALYSYQDNQITYTLINCGVGAATALSGTYTVEEEKISYNFSNSTGYSNFTYENGTLTLSTATGCEIKRLSATDLMGYLEQEESTANNDGVICLADLIVNYYPGSPESSVAAEKKDSVNAAKRAAGEAALKNLKTTYDKVQKLTWYQHKNEPQYTDICCYIYPYIGRMDSGYTWLRVSLNYTDAQTDAGWVFFNTVIFSVDGENTTKSFSRSDITRDNDTEVWETADFEPNASEIQLLRNIAASDETIIRFQGNEYYEDHIVTKNEKDAIVDVLAAYEYLKNNS